MKHLMEKLEQLLELGGIKKDVTFLVISGIAVICSLLKWNPLPFDMAWVAIVLCGIPIILEAVIGLVTAFEMEATKVGEDSSIRRMIRLAQSADAGKAKIVGIAMGGVGSDIAVDAADIALVDDEAKELPPLVSLSKRMMTTIKPNMTFSMTLNFIAITLAIIGTLNPVAGALVHNAGSVLVITNSAFLLKWRKK